MPKVKDDYMNWLRSPTMTQPAADTDIVFTAPTGVQARDKLLMEIHKIQAFLPVPTAINGAWTEFDVASEDISALFATQTHYALNEILAYFEIQFRALGASGGGFHNMMHEVNFDPPLIYAQPNITFIGRSAATTVANLFSGRVGFTWKRATLEDYLEAVEQYQ